MTKFKLLYLFLCIFLICKQEGIAQKKQSKIFKSTTKTKHAKHSKNYQSVKLKKDGDFEEDDKYDGIAAAQEYEFKITHDPATNTIPKDRLLGALAKRKSLIDSHPPITNGFTTLGNTAINAVTWVERGSNSDAPGPYGNPRDNNGVTSGRISALWNDIDATKPNQVFIGGIDGGLWSCPDITVSNPAWSFIDVFSNIAISSICQDPTNTAIMYFGTGEKTFNGDAVNGGGIWKSTDHGATWTLLNNTTSFYNVSKVLCDKNGYVYVGTIGSGVGLKRSTNGGSTWTTITPTVSSLATTRVSDMVYDATNDRMHVYMGYFPTAGSTRIGYCYGTPSTVTSGTWSVPTTGSGMTIAAASSSDVEQMVQLAVKNGVVWALQGNINDMILYRSTDGGVTWTLRNTITEPAVGPTIYGVGQDWYSIALDCDPASPSNNVIFGGLNVFKSTNGGATNTQMSAWTVGYGPSQYVHADVHNVYYGTNRVLVCSDGGLFYSSNAGSTWTDRNTGLRLKQFYSCAIHPSTPDYFLAGAQDNGSHQFTQAGLGSSTEVTGGDGAIVAIDQLSPANQVTSYVYNTYHISTDGGNNWSSNTWGNGDGQFINPFDFDSKTKKLYAAFTSGTYLRWDDPTTTQSTAFSVSVSSVIGANIATAITVSPNLSNTIYVAGGSALAKVTNANTASPTVTNITPAVTAGSNISSIIIGPSLTDQDLIVTSSSYGSKKVFVSANGGTSWTEITGNLPDMPVRWALFYPGTNTQALIATEAGVWYTTAFNGASTAWVPSSGIPAVRTDMIKYCDANSTIAVGTHGRGLWTTKISTTPKISFYSSLLNASKNSGALLTATCRNYTDYSDTILISGAPTGTATATLSVQSGATAIQGVDFDFTTNGSFTTPSTVATFTTGVYPLKIPIAIRIYNNHNKNAVLPQTANIIFAISGSTDAIASSLNQSISLSLTDVFPNTTTLTAQTLWSENWNAPSNAWVYSPDLSTSPINTTGFYPLFSSCSGNINTTTAQLLSTDGTGSIAWCSNNYSGVYTARVYRAVNALANRYSNMSVTFNYKSGANANIVNSLAYSTNGGTTWTILASYASKTTTTSATVAMPALLNNVNFLLGWQSVGSAASSYSAYGFDIDDIVFTGDITAPNIESIAASNTSNYETNGQSVDYYSTANNNIMANIASPSADLGCVSTTVENAGNTWQSYFGGFRSQKTFLITPTTNGSTATYNATLFYTTAELAGKTASTLRIAKTSASSVALATGANTILVTPTTAAYSTYGTAFTGSFTGFSRFFLVDNTVALPITLTYFTGYLKDNKSVLEWNTSSENNNKGFDIEKSFDGVNFSKIDFVMGAGTSSASHNYLYTDKAPLTNIQYYRLKQIDLDGKYAYSNIIAIKTNNNNFDLVSVNNPFNDVINMLFSKPPSGALDIQLFDMGGRKTYSTTKLQSNSSLIQVVIPTTLSKGMYILQITVNGQQFNKQLIKN